MIRALTSAVFIFAAAGFAACGSDSDDFESPTPAAVSGEPSFGSVKLATEIDAVSKAPITEVTSFPSDAQAMHATISVKNVPAGSEFLFRWTKGADEAGTIAVTVTADTPDSWVAGSIFPNGQVPPGDDWLVAVFFNGKTIASVAFIVEPA